MPIVGLIVEGSYDEAALSEMVRRCLSSNVQVVPRQCGNAIQLMRKFPGFLNEFEHVNAGRPVDKALVVRDADHKNLNTLIARMEEKIRERTYHFPTKLLIAVEELEAWLLADEKALAAVTGKPQRRLQNTELIFDPKAELNKILFNAGIVYTAEVARKIASSVSPNILAARCPSFKRFQDALLS